jgi:hypothetical protein
LVGWREMRRSLVWLIRQGPSVSIHPCASAKCTWKKRMRP